MECLGHSHPRHDSQRGAYGQADPIEKQSHLLLGSHSNLCRYEGVPIRADTKLTLKDIHMTKATGKPNTEPKYYPQIFERGIDPDVDDPTTCHDHSEIPDTWPPLDEILLFQNRVRNRVRDLITSGQVDKDRKLGRSLWLGFEHEVLHLETFLYMLLQSNRILSPPDGHVPDFAALASEARAKAVPNDWVTVPAATVAIGLDDPENDEGPDRYFGWDNERPSRKVVVPAFEAQARPITNGEYAKFVEKNKLPTLPASWTTMDKPATNGVSHTNGTHHDTNGTSNATVSHAFLEGKAIRTVYGLIPLEYALDWPIMASYNELAQYATWMNGRIPLMEEARSIYSYVEKLKKDTAQKVPNTLISAVNGYAKTPFHIRSQTHLISLLVTCPMKGLRKHHRKAVVLMVSPMESMTIANHLLKIISST